jgi:hypothetical protein
MAEYPYSKGSTNLLPDNFLEYFNAYNTRVVGNEAFKNEIRNYKQ